MTDAEKLSLVKTLTSEADDAIVTAYLSIAADAVIRRAYPMEDGVTEVPSKYHMIQCEAAAYFLQKRGAEGEVSHSENGNSRTYESGDLPASLARLITPFCHVPGFVRSKPEPEPAPEPEPEPDPGGDGDNP